MFGHRSDGKEAKDTTAIFRLMPIIMKDRCDSQVFFNQDVVITAIDEYISKKAEEGIKITLLDIVFAAAVRIIGDRKQLNRFAINGRIYDRNQITISMAVKKSLSDDGEETIIKPTFTGDEDLFEVRDKIQALIEDNKKEETENGMDKLVGVLNKIPSGVLKIAVNFLMWLDKHGIMPKAVIEASPFHTSCFITNVGSLGIDSIYHHLYNFGTTSMFLAIGKKKKSYVYEDDEVVKEKCINIGFVGDERICDGYYYAYSFRMLTKYLLHPELLEKNDKQEKQQEDKEEKEENKVNV